MTIQQWIDHLVSIGGVLSCEECDTIVILNDIKIMLSCVPTDKYGKVIKDFDFTPFDSNPKPAAYLSHIRQGNDWVFTADLLTEMPLLCEFKE